MKNPSAPSSPLTPFDLAAVVAHHDALPPGDLAIAEGYFRAWLRDGFPRGGWRSASPQPPTVEADGGAFERKRPRPTTAIVSWSRESDGLFWMHGSIAHPGAQPSYKEVAQFKEDFFGPHETCIQVFVPRSQHANIHPHALHLWCCVSDLYRLPDFTKGTRSI